MAAPLPLNSFLGGLTLPIPVHSLMLLNGNVFGISGFVHRATRGSSEALTAVAGLIFGGAIVGLIEGSGPQSTGLSISHLAASGFLVGLGTKVRARKVMDGPNLTDISNYPTVAPLGRQLLRIDTLRALTIP